jgi:hypothetical protein
MEELPKKIEGMNRHEIVEKVKSLNLPTGAYLVVGGGVMAVHGLRSTNDIDIVVVPSLFEELQKRGWKLDETYQAKWGTQRLKRDNIEIHPDFLFDDNTPEDLTKLIGQGEIIDGVAFQPPSHLLKVKSIKANSRTAREKDIQDIASLESYLAKK